MFSKPPSWKSYLNRSAILLQNISFSLTICFFIAIPRALGANEIDLASDTKIQPNVILIMTDDQGYGDIAAHGNPYLKTPQLDRLYKESIRFTDFHVNPFCAPTRAALMTGRMSDRTHVHSTVYLRNHLSKDETTMAEFFKASGYNTAHFGKWHLGENYPYRPMDRGFDEWVGIGDGGSGTASDFWGNDRMDDSYNRNGKWEEIKGFNTDVFFDETMKFIKKNEDKPFFVYLATNTPHGPMNVLKEWRDEYENQDFKMRSVPWGDTKDLFATITRIDDNIGRLRKFLDDNNLNENTMIIFLTDNGSSDGSHIFNAGMKGGKGSLDDGGHRVPCFIHWPAGGINKPIDIDRLTAHIDLLPTLIDMCRLETPEREHLKFDGRSLSPLIKDKDAKWDERLIIYHTQNIVDKQVKNVNVLVFNEKWRLITRNNKKELYDIKSDPSQKNNIASQFPEVVADLTKKYDEYWDELDMDSYPYPRPIIGTDHLEETWLNSINWIKDKSAVHSYDQPNVLAGAKSSGFWPVEIAEDGMYQFEVRRWPKEVNLPICASLPKQEISDITLLGKPVRVGEGKAIPVKKVRLKIDGLGVEQNIQPTDTYAEFTLELKHGDISVRAWLIDENDKKQGAYYVYVRRIK